MKTFSSRSQTFGPGQKIWADKFWTFRVFSANLSTPIFSTVGPLYMFPLINHYFYKKLTLYIQIPNIYLGMGFEFSRKELVI